jgi:hypothetical protein
VGVDLFLREQSELSVLLCDNSNLELAGLKVKGKDALKGIDGKLSNEPRSLDGGVTAGRHINIKISEPEWQHHV